MSKPIVDDPLAKATSEAMTTMARRDAVQALREQDHWQRVKFRQQYERRLRINKWKRRALYALVFLVPMGLAGFLYWRLTC